MTRLVVIDLNLVELYYNALTISTIRCDESSNAVSDPFGRIYVFNTMNK